MQNKGKIEKRTIAKSGVILLDLSLIYGIRESIQEI